MQDFLDLGINVDAPFYPISLAHAWLTIFFILFLLHKDCARQQRNMSALLTLTLMNKLMSLYRLCLPSDVQREMNDQITFSFKMYIDIFNKKICSLLLFTSEI